MSDQVKTDVAIWLERMGYTGRGVSEAASALGMSDRTLFRKRDGEIELTIPDRLAMAAVRVGLPAWTPENDADLVIYAALKSLLDAGVRSLTHSPPAAEPSTDADTP